jgi:hypothetical protein
MTTAFVYRAGLLLPLLLATAAAAPAADEYVIPPAKRDHWAWKRPLRPPVPGVRDCAWVRNPVDAFVLARLEAEGIPPAPAAPREQLLRRVTLDLLGLPPTPAEVDLFVNDSAPDAWEKVVDRLLGSPHYGERWGRHWLDLARFAESNGYEFDEVRPNAYRYRDYVLAAFNDDRPYDRFVREQLAGDELYPDDLAARVATGFNVLGPDMTDSSDQAQRRQNTLNDMTDTAALSFLGLTVACARCHDHKFEPIPQTDYYRLQAFFSPAVFRRDLPIATAAERAAHDAAEKEYNALVKPLQDELAALERPYREKLYAERLARLSDEAQAAHRTPEARRTAAQQELVEKTARLLGVTPESVVQALTPADRLRHQELREKLKQFDGRKPPALPVAMGLADGNGPASRTFLLERGELSNHGEEVQPGFPIILTPEQQALPARLASRPGGAGRRAALAEWVAGRDNPLTARVLVNRVWQHHFGRGLVPTPSDFGVRGQRPTHPELLDWLAVAFMDGGWSLKRLHRLLLTSAAYRQSSKPAADALARDPDNRLLSRLNRVRLEGEVIRDCLLAVSGRLNRKMGGPGVFPPVPDDALRGTRDWTVSPDPRDHVRRSVYVFARRNLRFPFLEAFDLPDSNLSCPKREGSTTAPQALALLNDGDVVTAAQALAARVSTAAASEDERITLAYRLTLGRRPSQAERGLARDFLGQAPLSELCRALFNVNEFVYVD